MPDDVSDLMFGCTVPGHFPGLMHGPFVVTPPEKDTEPEIPRSAGASMHPRNSTSDR